MRVLVLALVLARATADWDNFPVKSQHLQAAQSIAFYNAYDSLPGSTVSDLHPVHGIQTSDGGYVVTGKSLEPPEGPLMTAFAAKFDAAGTMSWAWASNVTGANDAANAVMQLPGGGDLIVAGYRSVNGVNQRSLTKLALADGSEEWTAAWPAATASEHGAWEMIDLTHDGSAVLLAGLSSSTDSSEFNFKSYGNVISGKAFVARLLVSALTAATAPVEGDAAWTWETTGGYLTSKAARSLSDGSVVALLYAETQLASLVKLSASGVVEWGPTDYGAQHGEGTDVVIAPDGTGFVISGQGAGGVAGTLSGRLSLVSLSGTYSWGRSYSSIDYSAGGSSSLIKNECWGLKPLADGYVVGCGTGIENCDNLSGQTATDCAAGTADARPNAVPRAASVWQSMIFRTDLNGTLQWLRTDQWRPSGAPALGANGWQASSSASEYVITTSDGGFTSVNDEVSGIGLLRLSAPTASSATTVAAASGGTTAAASSAATTAGSGCPAGQHMMNGSCMNDSAHSTMTTAAAASQTTPAPSPTAESGAVPGRQASMFALLVALLAAVAW